MYQHSLSRLLPSVMMAFCVCRLHKLLLERAVCVGSNLWLYMGHYQKMEQSRKAKRKKLIVHFFFFNGIVLVTGAYRI